MEALITVLPGDGIGPEVTEQARRVMVAAGAREGLEFEFQEELIGGCSIDAHGTPLRDEVIEACRESRAILLGAVGGPKWDDMHVDVRPEKGLLGIRKALGLFANLRPAAVLPALVNASALRPEIVEGVDLLVVRELTGGIYFGEPRGIFEENGERVGINTQRYTESEIARVARSAFELARVRGNKVCSMEKANVMESGILWRDVVTEVSADYPEVELSHMYADNGAMQLVRAPKQFDVILTDNLFGDILSDCAAMLTGSIGMLPSASLSASGPGLYEPIHGSAPDIAGRGIANPFGAILSAAMLLRHSLGLEAEAAAVEAAVWRAVEEGVVTPDLAGGAGRGVSTETATEAVARSVEGAAPGRAIA